MVRAGGCHPLGEDARTREATEAPERAAGVHPAAPVTPLVAGYAWRSPASRADKKPGGFFYSVYGSIYSSKRWLC